MIKPAYDYSLGYPFDLRTSDWNPDVNRRRKAGWMDAAADR